GMSCMSGFLGGSRNSCGSGFSRELFACPAWPPQNSRLTPSRKARGTAQGWQSRPRQSKLRAPIGAVSSAVEHCLHTARVTSSNLVPPTTKSQQNQGFSGEGEETRPSAGFFVSAG